MLHLPVTTPSAGLLMETGIWPEKERTENSTPMLIYISSTATKKEYHRRLF